MNKKVCVIGLGYIGLSIATLLAHYEYDVVGVDTNEEIVSNLNEGKIIIKEPYLDILVKDVIQKKKLKVSNIPCEADIFIIAVQTPINKYKSADLRYVISATSSILSYLKKGDLIILESTSPVGTTQEIIKPILESCDLEVSKDIYLGYCPEKVYPGNILNELVKNDRVIGGIDDKSSEKLKEFYYSFVKGNIYVTDIKTAEMVKLVENAYRDVNIAFANELLKICNEIDLNVWNVIKYSNKHPRVNILNPGPGVGGNCLGIDPWFIVEDNQDLANIIKLSRDINDSMPYYVFEKIEKLTINILGLKKITILGITYKANVDDIRESPIIDLIKLLKNAGYTISIYDPFVDEYEFLEKDLIKACEDSDLVVLGVDHTIFKDISFKDIKKVMKGNILLDTRNFLDRKEIEDVKFIYKLLGDN